MAKDLIKEHADKIEDENSRRYFEKGAHFTLGLMHIYDHERVFSREEIEKALMSFALNCDGKVSGRRLSDKLNELFGSDANG